MKTSREDRCPKCQMWATIMEYQKGTLGQPESMVTGEIIMCVGCHLQKDGDRWVNPYDELKRVDDRYRAEQN